MNYFDYNAGQNSRIESDFVEPDFPQDTNSTTTRIAIDARKLGLSAERTEELMLQAGAGIEVREISRPADPHYDDACQGDARSVRQRLIALQDKADA